MVDQLFRYIMAMLLIALNPAHGNAQDQREVKTINLKFEISDFNMDYNAAGALEISTYKHIASYGDNVNEPGLPLISVNVLVRDNQSYKGLEVNSATTTINENVDVAPNPIVVPTDYCSDNLPIREPPQYEKKTYPMSCACYVGTSVMDGYTILNFLVSPFEYDAEEKSLYFHEEITLGILLGESLERTITSHRKGYNMHEIVRSLVVNPDDMEEVRQTRSITATDTIEKYIIITSSTLAPAFQALAQWKRTKGYDTEIITIEDVMANYAGATTQLKIKSCLYDQYLNHNLKYALLGGDDSVVPVQGCYAKAGNDSIFNMPTDLFFSCFNGNFIWDADGDGVYGETTDSINMAPSIFLTRLPVRSSTDVEAIVSKLLTYERMPTANGWNNNILMAGCKLDGFYPDSTKSDAEAQGDEMYKSYIQPYWPGTRYKFYDTYTDFPGGATYELNYLHLLEQLQRGYTFFDMATHGNSSFWYTESGPFFNASAQILNNTGFTVITTIACSTNAFDDAYAPCLSEAFIRNANSGVIAYLGCSRKGWGTIGNVLGASWRYEGIFYQNLFSSEYQNNHFGAIAASAKVARINYSRSNNPNRWVQFGLNPIGDPEMPIYTTTPMEFTNSQVTFGTDSIRVSTGVEGCTVCVMSLEDYGDAYHQVKNDVEIISFPSSTSNVSICITKQNYTPIIFKSTDYIQNETITGSQVIVSDEIKVGTSVNSSQPHGPVVFDKGNILLRANNIIIEPETTIESGTELIITNP